MVYRILVVDDEESVRQVLARFLTRKGFSVFTAGDGPEALDLIKKERPHLMLLDVRMPGMDGMQVLRSARELDKEIGILVATAVSDVDLAKQMMSLGAFDYILKPFDLSYLETTVMAKLFLMTP
ncbi:MAG: response regulator [Elusimicrobia bacterium]|nr:response regulator [Elusimicrobiota bacterium]